MNIPDEVVEAAIEALRTPVPPYRAEGVMTWEQIARCVLEAAAPHLLAKAWDDAFDKGSERGAWEAAPVTTEPHFTNPYRSQA